MSHHDTHALLDPRGRIVTSLHSAPRGDGTEGYATWGTTEVHTDDVLWMSHEDAWGLLDGYLEPGYTVVKVLWTGYMVRDRRDRS